MRATWDEWKDGTPGIQITKRFFSRRNPEHAIRSQAYYLRWLYNRFVSMNERNRLTAVLVSYNWGIGRVKRMIRKMGRIKLQSTPKETQKYVLRIKSYLDSYKVKIHLCSRK